jgi:hypothetical protein
MENIMSDEMETQQSTMDAMLQAIQYKNLAQSRAHFDNLMQDKISDALEAEKINIASQIYNPQAEVEEPEEDFENETMEADAESDWDDVEAEVEAAFEEGDEEELEV